MKSTETIIYLLRHGLPDGDDCLRGHTDFKLTDLGLAQMQHASASIEHLDAIHSSPLQRCADFAHDWAIKNTLPMNIKPELIEYDFGDWDGKPFKQLWQQDGEALGNFFEKPWLFTPPNGETHQHFSQRLNTYWQKILDEYQNKAILICTHGGVIRHFLARVLELPDNSNTVHNAISIPYAALIKISVTKDDTGKYWPKINWPAPINHLEQ